MSNLNLPGESTTVIHETDEFGFVPDTTIWLASPFTTGPQESTISSMITRLQSFGGSNEFVSIYTDSSGEPGTSFGTFLDNPTDLGTNDQFRFTPNGTITLSANTTYWMVFGVSGSQNTEFNVFWTDSADETGAPGWSIGDRYSTFNGSTWSFPSLSGNSAVQFGIVPEPADYALAIGGMLCIFIFIRRRRLDKSFQVK